MAAPNAETIVMAQTDAPVWTSQRRMDGLCIQRPPKQVTTGFRRLEDDEKAGPAKRGNTMILPFICPSIGPLDFAISGKYRAFGRHEPKPL